MTRIHWWQGGLVGILMIAGVLGGCGDDDDDFDNGIGDCVLFGEVEPNDTAQNAQVLDDMFVGDCFLVDGELFDALDVDSYRVFVQTDLRLVVALDHSTSVDFDVQLFDADTGQLILDCGSNVVPEVCEVPFTVLTGDIAVDAVVVPVVGAGLYRLELSAE
jgi:hypothetical protein